MLKWIFIAVIAIIAVIDIALVVACSHLENEAQYLEYMKWKERNKNE